MRTYTKDDVEFHNDGGIGGPWYPAINVKVYSYPSVWKVADEFDCPEEVAQQALEWSFQLDQQVFWEEVQAIADDILAPHFGKVEVRSAGRSNGWLIVDGVADHDWWQDSVIAGWDAIDIAKWRKFERVIKAIIDDLTSWEHVKENIAANRWTEPGAQEFNFYEFADGHRECFVDMAA